MRAMIQRVLILSLGLLNAASAMEASPQNNAKTSHEALTTQQTGWQKLQELYTSYQKNPSPSIRGQIIQGLYSLLNTGHLDQLQKNQALIMAQILKAPHLARRIEWNQSRGDHGDLTLFPEEILQEMIGFLGQGGLKDLKNLLLANKSFYQIIASARLYLDLSPYGNKITDEMLAQIIELFPNVVSLNLSGCEEITDAGLAHLKELTQLTDLNLVWCHLITDAGLAHLARLTQLTSLNLFGCALITDAGLAHLARLTQLTDLNLVWCHLITDAGLAHLAGLAQLTSLNLSDCALITDAGLAHLAGLAQLTYLDLSDCALITDAGLAHLKELTQLTLLDLLGCEKVTPHGKQSLKKVLPMVKIIG